MKKKRHSNSLIGHVEKYCGVCSSNLDLSKQVCPNCELSVCPKCIKKSVLDHSENQYQKICDNCYPQIFKHNIRSRFEKELVKEYSELNDLNDNLKKEQFKTYEQTIKESKLKQEINELTAKQKAEEMELLIEINNAENITQKLSSYVEKKDKKIKELIKKHDNFGIDMELVHKSISEIKLLLDCEENKMIQLENMLQNEMVECNRLRNQLQYAKDIELLSNSEIKSKKNEIEKNILKATKNNKKMKKKIEEEERKNSQANIRKWEIVIKQQQEEIETLKSSILSKR